MKQFLKSEKLTTTFILSFILAPVLYYFVVLPGHAKSWPGFIGGLLIPWSFVGLIVFFTLGFIVLLVKVYHRLKYKSPCRRDVENEVKSTIFFNLCSLIACGVFSVIAIPHMYASYKLEKAWKGWVDVQSNSSFRKRDQILYSIGFDYSTSLRFWQGRSVPGLYLPQSYLRLVGIQQNGISFFE
jgi:hypothetical protein